MQSVGLAVQTRDVTTRLADSEATRAEAYFARGREGAAAVALAVLTRGM